MNSFISRIGPFIFIGILIVLFVIGLMLLYYLLIFGAAVGLILFAIAWLREKLFKPKKPRYPIAKRKSGHTIDHDDLE